MALLPEEVLVRKLVEYAGGLSELREAVKRATKWAGRVPDLRTLLKAIEEVRREARLVEAEESHREVTIG